MNQRKRIGEMIRCSKCGMDLEDKAGKNVIASISGSIMGDETIETFFHCPACDSYTLELCHDRFCGDATARMEGPFILTDVEERIALIRKCAVPWDKTCRCDAHRIYFEGWLD